MQVTAKPSAKTKLLDAALSVIRSKGYAATTVDDLCASAGVTKGAFFHHFKSKEDLGVAAADYWSETTGGLFAQAPYNAHADPLERLLGYVDFRQALLQGSHSGFHLPRRHDGAGDLRQQPRHPRCLRALHQYAYGEDRGRHQRGDRDVRHRPAVDGREPRPLHAGDPARRFHPGQGQGRRPGRGTTASTTCAATSSCSSTSQEKETAP